MPLWSVRDGQWTNIPSLKGVQKVFEAGSLYTVLREIAISLPISNKTLQVPLVKVSLQNHTFSEYRKHLFHHIQRATFGITCVVLVS